MQRQLKISYGIGLKETGLEHITLIFFFFFGKELLSTNFQLHLFQQNSMAL